MRFLLILLHSLPLAFGILLDYLFWRNNLLLFLLYLVVIIWVIGSGKDPKTEIYILGYGMLAGFVIETIGTSVAGYQSFAQPDFFGIPYWLLLAWGYAPVLLKRLALIIATGSPWVKTK